MNDTIINTAFYKLTVNETFAKNSSIYYKLNDLSQCWTGDNAISCYNECINAIDLKIHNTVILGAIFLFFLFLINHFSIRYIKDERIKDIISFFSVIMSACCIVILVYFNYFFP